MVELTNEGSSAGINTGSSTGIDTNSHLYIHPSDSPGVVLVPVPFDGTGFHSWRRSVLRSLSVKNKLIFINGECKHPPKTDPTYRQWVRCDDMVTSLIVNSLGREVADSVEYVGDALELWTELEDRYDQTNGAQLYQTQKVINDLSQAKTNLQKVEQDRRLIQFLMGLNEVYTIIRGSILMMNPLPSMEQAFALLVQEEKQREFKPNNQLFVEGSSLLAGSSSSSNSSGGRNFTTNYSSSNITSNAPRSRPYCDYCRRPGHTRVKCYKLHGYPPGLITNNPRPTNHDPQHQNQIYNNQNSSHRNNKGKGIEANSVSLSCDIPGNQDGSSESHFNDQGNNNINLTREHPMEDQNAMHMTSGAVNFAGTLTCSTSIDFDKLSCECFKTRIDLWILDSGASHHMTFDRNLLVNLITLPYPLLVRLPNGYRVKITEIGSVCLTSEITLYKAPSLKRPLEIGKAHDGLYFLCSDCLQQNNSSHPKQQHVSCSSDYSYYHHPSTPVKSDPGPVNSTNQPLSPTLSTPTTSPIGPSNPTMSSTLPHTSIPICHPARPALRRSHRIHRVPPYLSDYVHRTPPDISSQPPTSLNAHFSLNHHISPAALNPKS
ncbi:uncharacterized protein LOC125858815 [Solanum stenotomum]|uniref:uncharacterized protein LOC125858815 n=1 Tax=Solanum stenotomum TaxID=172797 RepID=UPI0020D1B304|nr:uncharacterized protein LOC125858815 [Solanum stenotomum]